MKKQFLSLSVIVFTIGIYAVSFFCSAPKKSGDWMDQAIAKDFQHYEKNGISKESLEESWNACKRHQEFLRYQVIDSKIYGPDSRMKILLEEIVNHYPLPDIDFIYYYEDRIKKSFFERKKHQHSAPIFVSAKNKKVKQAILFADWNYNIRDQTSGWNCLIQKVHYEPSNKKWADKSEKLVWRGTPWDGARFNMYNFENWKSLPRGAIVFAAKNNPELIDAAFSEYPKKCAEQDFSRCIFEMGDIRPISWEEMLQYKYHAIIDGVTCTFPALQWKLLSGSLCFKQESDDIQYYYDELIPWKHYVPLKRDLSDLKERILWAKSHDSEAEQIAKNGKEFVLTHLMPEHILLYCYKALLKYASLQKFQPQKPQIKSDS